jgi:predicted nucleic acid-binding protein
MTFCGARPDKGYSLTDCISMQTMRKEGLTEVLTKDRHFEQEGFRGKAEAMPHGAAEPQPRRR